MKQSCLGYSELILGLRTPLESILKILQKYFQRKENYIVAEVLSKYIEKFEDTFAYSEVHNIHLFVIEVTCSRSEPSVKNIANDHPSSF